MGEDLYRPSEILLPPKVEEALAGVVRVDPKIRFRLTIFEKAEEAAAARPQIKKEFLPEGGAIWPVVLDVKTLGQLCNNPIASLQPGFYELCQALREFGGQTFPATLLTQPLAGSATGFVIGRSGKEFLIVTCYHVARDVIERNMRTQGVYRPTPVQALDLKVRVSWDGTHGRDSYREVQPVFLIANASSTDWQQGRDWAVLSIPGDAPVKILRIASQQPKVGETLWAAGFPCRTHRPAERLQALRYSDAADEMRVSVGEVVEFSPSGEILVDLDGVSGNSGSPVLNEAGEVVGILHDTTFKEGELDLRIGGYGGLAKVVPIESVRAVLVEIMGLGL